MLSLVWQGRKAYGGGPRGGQPERARRRDGRDIRQRGARTRAGAWRRGQSTPVGGVTACAVWRRPHLRRGCRQRGGSMGVGGERLAQTDFLLSFMKQKGSRA